MNHIRHGYSKSCLDKIGNTIIFLAKEIKYLSKTKLLKLLYILEEYSIKKYGIPFLGLKFDLWSLGPVSKDIFVEISSDPVMLKDYISVKRNSKGHTYIKPAHDFNDNEFSDMEIEFLEKFTEFFRSKDLDELISYTHRPNGIWKNTAIRENVLGPLESNTLVTTDIQLDLSELIVDSKEKKIRYAEYIKFLQDNNHIPA